MKKRREYNQTEFLLFLEKVEEVLESFDYPALVEPYKTEDVANSLAKTAADCYFYGESPMMTAIIIWSLTMTMQIIPDAQKAVRH